MYSRRGIKLCNSSSSPREKREKAQQTLRPVKKEGPGGVPGIGEEILLQSVVKTMVRQLCPCIPWRSIVDQRSTCLLWRIPHIGAHGCSKEAVTAMESPQWSRFWLNLWTHGQRSPGWLAGLVSPWRAQAGAMENIVIPEIVHQWEGTTLGRFKTCSLWEWLEKLMKDCLPWDGPPRWSRRRVWGGEWQSSKCWTGCRPIPCLLCCWRKRGRKIRVKLSSIIRERGGEGVFSFVLISYYLLSSDWQ